MYIFNHILYFCKKYIMSEWAVLKHNNNLDNMK